MDIQGNTRHYVVIRATGPVLQGTELLLAGNAGRLPSVALEASQVQMPKPSRQPDFVDGNLPYCTSLEVKCSELHGNGIYARKPLLEGEVVEYAPSVLLMRSEMGNLFVDYRYSAESLRQGLFRLLLGNGSIYNHSAEPNLGYRRVRVDRSSEAAQGLSVCFYAKRDIAAGEELLISYGKTWWSSRGIHDATGVPQAQLLLPEGRVTWLDEQVSLATWCYA
ncbi:SET domain-containing protein 7 [Durusdinium trenchii]|uniref:SET domain-containing protein 7 n=1 Tax=Durusdinium trenchii TaxID=1381693 RepID=A0ABP0HHK2_9DINO